MAPTIRTAEYVLLTRVRDYMNVKAIDCNQVALSVALVEGYVKYDGVCIVLTDAGFDRIDQLGDK